MDALDILIRKQWAINGGSPVNPERAVINLICPTATLVDNPVTKQSDLTIGGASDWTLFTPSPLNTTNEDFLIGNGVVKARTRRVGNDLEIDVLIKKGSTTTFGTGSFVMPLNGATVNSSLCLFDGSIHFAPGVVRLYSGQQTSFPILCEITNGEVHAVDNSQIIAANGGAINTGDRVGLFASVPVI